MSDSDYFRKIGTPGEYTDDLYRVYFEVGEFEDSARNAIASALKSYSQGSAHFDFTPSSLRQHSHGYEVDIPMQLIPEIVRELAARNVAVYQIVRINRL